jgi:phenylalanyl-tRNA synthetase alpha chain
VDPADLARVESTYLGKKGSIKVVLRDLMPQVSAEDRPRLGQAANAAQDVVERAVAERRQRLEDLALEVRLAQERTDVTLPGRHVPVGSLHPYHETNREIARIFGQFGFVVYEGPEVETDELNFQALNIPLDHPARDLWDTMYVSHPVPATGGRYLLRTHTSPTQIRVMESVQPPIRALMPGRCFRYEAVDASHGSEFYQVEGLMIDEGTTLAHLRGLLDQFAVAMFGPRETRFRPGYYPFTEPSVAFDVQCVICDGVGCPSCQRSGWMTILGAGMVHPHVIARGGLDPERYQGFAFGMGTDRIAMLRHDIHDLRVFLQNDLRVLEQL